MKDFLFFNKLITPSVITAIYIIASVLVILGGIFVMFTGEFFKGLLGTLGGLFMVRMYCELIIVMFKNNEHLRKIANKE
ncbi:DUF4282 domain-containing protein [Thorsellia kenyensis]|uniref:DUF4282 domain-containing protein n=1 Tax=Thorsellia kenyensis TaxID=1549888 RepID=A0ABV6CBK5_9GAMM